MYCCRILYFNGLGWHQMYDKKARENEKQIVWVSKIQAENLDVIRRLLYTYHFVCYQDVFNS